MKINEHDAEDSCYERGQQLSEDMRFIVTWIRIRSLEKAIIVERKLKTEVLREFLQVFFVGFVFGVLLVIFIVRITVGI